MKKAMRSFVGWKLEGLDSIPSGLCRPSDLLALRRALRNGTVWIDHSLAFRSRERLFTPTETWQKERNSYYRPRGPLTN